MPRNFHRRVEVMFPIEDPSLKRRILKEVIPTYLRDNTRTRRLESDGSYTRVRPQPGEAAHRSQEEFLAMRGGHGPAAVAGGENGEAAEHGAEHAVKEIEQGSG